LTGCEGPAGPAGSAGSQGPAGGGFNADEQAFIHANGFAVALSRRGVAAAASVTASGATVSTTAIGTITGDEPIAIPDGVTLNVGYAITVPASKTLTISGGARSKLALNVASAITLTDGTAQDKTTLNITVPTGVSVAVVNPLSATAGNRIINITNKTVTITAAAVVPNTAVTGLGLTPAQVDVVITNGAAALGAVTPFKSVELKGGTVVGHATYKYDAPVKVTGPVTIGNAAITLDDDNNFTIANGGSIAGTSAITVSGTGKIIVAQGGTLNNAGAGSTFTSATHPIEVSGTLAIGSAAVTTMPAITIKNGGNLAVSAAYSIGTAAVAMPTVENGGKITVADAVTLTLSTNSGILNLSAGGKIVLGAASVVTLTGNSGTASTLRLSANKFLKGQGGTAASLATGEFGGEISATDAALANPNNIAGKKTSDIFGNSTASGFGAVGSSCIKATIASNHTVLTAPAAGATISKDSLILVTAS
jgi:hypothetical protein